jgi:hypothetical protein
MYKIFTAIIVQNLGFCIVTPVILNADTDVSEVHAASIHKREVWRFTKYLVYVDTLQDRWS